jgi:hypothetical protein
LPNTAVTNLLCFVTHWSITSQLFLLCFCIQISMHSLYTRNQSIKYIYKALFTSADDTTCLYRTQLKTPNSK